jgi:hypothetical protein
MPVRAPKPAADAPAASSVVKDMSPASCSTNSTEAPCAFLEACTAVDALRVHYLVAAGWHSLRVRVSSFTSKFGGFFGVLTCAPTIRDAAHQAMLCRCSDYYCHLCSFPTHSCQSIGEVLGPPPSEDA